MDMRDIQYKAIYTDTGKNEQTIDCDSFGLGVNLYFTVVDEFGTAVDLTTVGTNMKLYVGTHLALKIDGGTLTGVLPSAGTVRYTLVADSFLEADAGTYNVELQFCDNADPAVGNYIMRVGNCYLTVIDTING